jgi:hypothetical protein
VSIGTAIFCSVVLVLLVINKPFRKVMAWIAGIGAVLAILACAGYWLYLKYQDHVAKVEAEKWAAGKSARVVECMQRYRNAVAITGWFIPPYSAVKTDDGHVDAQATCENNELSEWKSTSAPAPAAPAAPPALTKPSNNLKIIATISENCASSDWRTLWNEPDYMPERRILRIFKGGETVEYVGKNITDDIVVYHGVRGYISSNCVTVQEQ